VRSKVVSCNSRHSVSELDVMKVTRQICSSGMLTFCAVVYGPFVMLNIVLGARVLSLVSFGCLY